MKIQLYFIATLLNIFLCTYSSFASEFITRWDMSLSSGSGTNQIKFEVGTSGPVSYTWETIPAGTTFSGTFIGPIVTISGIPAGATIRLKIDSANFHQFRFNNLIDRFRLKDVEQWGSIQWSTMNSTFRGCPNLNMTATDIPDLSNVTDMHCCFASCPVFNSTLNNWNVSNVVKMDSMFYGASVFNQPLNNWNVSNVNNMSSMFWNDTSFNQPLDNWNVGSVTEMSSMFRNAIHFNQPIDNWNVSNVTNMSSMFEHATNFNQAIGSWNVSIVTDMSSMFSWALNFNQPLGSWNVGNVDDMNKMFLNAVDFNQSIGNWNVINVTNTSGMFAQSTNFNQPIGNWNVSNVTDMSGMFNASTNFNQVIGNWDVSSVTNMTSLFGGATFFNQAIGNWDVSHVTSMESMFEQATSFNQAIGNWDVSHVTSMESMFEQATSFNQAIGNWDVSNVSNMFNMFINALAFNQPIGNWNVSNVNTMVNMFNGAIAFDQPLANWNVGNVIAMHFMFANTIAFNQPIDNWDVSHVTNAPLMFFQAQSFNQPLGNWDVSNMFNVSKMFFHASNFNQSLGNWTLSANAYLINMLDSSGMDCSHYSQTIHGWANNPSCPINRSLGAMGMQYGTNLLADRDFLVNVKGWTINGDTMAGGNCCLPISSVNTLSTCNSFWFNGQWLTASGIYYDTLVNSNGCDSVLTLNLTITPIDKNVVTNAFSLWSNQPGATSYQWINCVGNIPIPGATNQGYTTISGGSYAVIINYNGCVDTSNCTTVIGLGTTSGLGSDPSITMLPNPANDKLIIQNSTNESLVINIYDLLGRLVYQQTLASDQKEMRVDIRSLNSGQYVVKFLQNGETLSVKKLTVSR